MESALVCRPGVGQKFVRYWRRYNCARNQCVFAKRLHIRLPLSAAFDRRISRSTGKVANLLPRLRLRELPESAPHALGMAESVLGRLYRSVRAALCYGNLDRLANRLSVKALRTRTALSLVFETLRFCHKCAILVA